MRPTSRQAAAVSVLLLCGVAACELQGSCPAGASNVGTFALSYAQFDAGDTCIVTRAADGGVTDAGVVATPAATSATFCAGPGDGGSPQIYVHFAGDSIRTAATDGGTFALTASQVSVAGTNCLCAVDIAQSLSGTLKLADGGTLTADPDGGFPAAAQLSGSLDETFAASAGSTGCACSPNPCGVHFAITGVP